MGAKGSKKNVPEKKATNLNSKDLKFLTQQTGVSEQQIKEIFVKFNTNNPDGKLDKKEFIRLYDELRPESADKLDEISEFAFRAFDTDHNGSLTFQEFMVAYALTSRGDLSQKLNYAFDLYDVDGSGSLTTAEVKAILHAMLDLLGADRKGHNEQALADQCMKELDANHDGKLSKDEFVKGLMANYSLRSLMSPFN